MQNPYTHTAGRNLYDEAVSDLREDIQDYIRMGLSPFEIADRIMPDKWREETRRALGHATIARLVDDVFSEFVAIKSEFAGLTGQNEFTAYPGVVTGSHMRAPSISKMNEMMGPLAGVYSPPSNLFPSIAIDGRTPAERLSAAMRAPASTSKMNEMTGSVRLSPRLSYK